MQQTRRVGRLTTTLISLGTLVVGLLVGLNWSTIAYEAAQIIGLCDAVKRQPIKLCQREELDLAEVQSLYKELSLSYDGALDRTQLLEGAKRGLVAGAGDPYTVFMNRTEAAEYRRGLSGDIGYGVGVEIGLRSNKMVVLRVVEDNPAERAGLRAGDEIVQVDDRSTIGLSAAEVANLVRGENGSEVTLKIQRGGKLEQFTLRRERINNPSVVVEYAADLAIVKLTRFDHDTPGLLREKITELKDRGATGLVLDLRGNGGGFVDSAQKVLGFWLDDLPVMTEQSRFKSTELRSPRDEAILAGFPTVVLIDGGTASAAEITAGALRHYEMATLIGEESYGKGSVQKMVDLQHGEMLKVTIARWLLPDGLNLAENGLKPDQVVELSLADLEAMRDPQLEAGKARLEQ